MRERTGSAVLRFVNRVERPASAQGLQAERSQPRVRGASGAMRQRTAEPPNRRAAGFTLIEVVVVLVLLGIVAGVTVPAFRNTALGGPRAVVTGEVLRLLEGARATALDQATVTRLMLDPRTGNYRIETDSMGHRVSLREGRLTLPAGVTLEGGPGWAAARFTANGTAVADSIVVRGSGGVTHIGVDTWTGLPRAD